MNNYRKILYPVYRSTIYAAKNSDDIRAYHEYYRLDYKRRLPANKDALILDVGCGSGHFLQYLKDEGYKNSEGIDISKQQCDYAMGFGLKVTRVDDAITFLANCKCIYDQIYLSDVLEHFSKDEITEILGYAYSALLPGGSVVIRVPNMANIIASYNRYIDFTHEVGFVDSSLTQILTASGFSSVEVVNNCIPFGLHPKRLSRWILLKLWYLLLKWIYLLEVGIERPRLLGPLLVAQAYKPCNS